MIIPKVKILALLFFISVSHLQQAQTNPRPNIVIIFADDLGYGEIEPYGQKIIQTPWLKTLADEGVKFTDFYSSSALCAPARCQLLTGLHSGHSAIRANFEMAQGPDSFTDLLEKGQMPLPSDQETIAEMLKPKGYATACIGKWGLGMADTEGNPNQQGFDYFFGYLDQKQAHNYYPTHLWENGKRVELTNPFIKVHTEISADQVSDKMFQSFIGKEYSIDKMATKAKEFIDRQKGPFFLYYSITLPHLALQVPEQELEPYLNTLEDKPYLGDKGYCPVQYPRATYAAMISYLDKKVGDIIKQLKETGKWNNTLLIFTSDNGPAFPIGGCDPEFFNSSGNLRSYKGSLYEGGIRVPFIATWPGKIKSGAINNSVAVGYDLKATIADLLSKEIATDGQSLLPALLRGKIQTRDYLYFELSEYTGQQAVRQGRWKLVKRNMNKDKYAKWELYDLAHDISEAIDLADKYPKVVSRMAKLAKEAHHHHLTRSEWNFMESTQN